MLKQQKTVNQQVYCEMCSQMFSNIRNAIAEIQHIQNAMDDQTWSWQQDGARAHKARTSDQFLLQSTLNFIDPKKNWPSKNPDLNIMDYCVWSWLFTELQNPVAAT